MEFKHRVKHTLSHRQLLFTMLGCVRARDLNLEFGDSIVVMAGSLVPFVLRQGTDGRYRLVAEAYVNGITFGKAIKEGGEWEVVMLK